MFSRLFWIIFHFFSTVWKKSYILALGQFTRGSMSRSLNFTKNLSKFLFLAIKLYWHVIWLYNYYQSMHMGQENVFHMRNISQKQEESLLMLAKVAMQISSKTSSWGRKLKWIKSKKHAWSSHASFFIFRFPSKILNWIGLSSFGTVECAQAWISFCMYITCTKSA